jgi:hypothetical protein
MQFTIIGFEGPPCPEFGVAVGDAVVEIDGVRHYAHNRAVCPEDEYARSVAAGSITPLPAIPLLGVGVLGDLNNVTVVVVHPSSYGAGPIIDTAGWTCATLGTIATHQFFVYPTRVAFQQAADVAASSIVRAVAGEYGCTPTMQEVMQGLGMAFTLSPHHPGVCGFWDGWHGTQEMREDVLRSHGSIALIRYAHYLEQGAHARAKFAEPIDSAANL